MDERQQLLVGSLAPAGPIDQQLRNPFRFRNLSHSWRRENLTIRVRPRVLTPVDPSATIRQCVRQPDRYRRLRAVFDEALLQEPSTREAFVDRACASDPELRPELMRLLAAHHEVGPLLEHSPNLLLSAVRAQEHFPGTSRFRVIRRLGAGGMGVVYEVHDGVRDEVVALKTLLRTGAADFYRLKREFRSLSDVAHPNLVCLYELFVEDERCFFTMELVKGVSFVDYVRGADRAQRSDARLVDALRQLIEGVSALHRGGKLHRDIKPSNVLVTPEGRVVILDFGLITELLPQNAGGAEHVLAGTPAYMSPEEGSGAPPSEASDWYGVGVTLYEALTGAVPFAGSLVDVLAQEEDHRSAGSRGSRARRARRL